MTITLRQETTTGATTKGDSLTFSELDNNFIDILNNKIQAIDLNADSGQTTLGQALANEKFTIAGGTGITTALTTDSAGEAVITINQDTADTNTTYTIGATVDGSNANFTLTGSDASTDTIQFVAGSNITLNVDSAGAIEIAATDAVGIANVVEDTTPQLGGSLDVNGQSIVSVSNGNITLAPNGTGNIQLTPATGSVIIDYATWPAEGTNGYVLSTNGAGTLSWVAQPSAGIANVVEDTTPQLGGTLDGQGNEINNVILEDYSETVYALGSTDTPTITVSNGNVQSVTITSGLSLPAFSDAATGQTVTLIVTGSGTASGTGAYKFAGGNTTLTSFSVVSIFYDGTTYWASIATDFQ